MPNLGDHKRGDLFSRIGYTNDDCTLFIRQMLDENGLQFSQRTLKRAEDLTINYLEITRTVSEGEVVANEVGPSRREMRLEVRAQRGDLAEHRVVVWLSMDHDLFAEDIR